MSEEHDVRPELYRRYVSTHTSNVQRTARFAGRRMFPITRYLPADKSARVLDIGCGEGDLAVSIRQLGYETIAGVDVSEEQVQSAHDQGRDWVVRSDLLDYLAQHREQFDAITAVDVLEHFNRSEVMTLLAAVHSALAPTGLFIAQMPNAVSPFFGNYAFGDFTHETVFTARSVRQICTAAGFDAVQIFPVPPQVHGVVSALRLALWKTFSTAFKLVLATETGSVRGHIVTQNIIVTAARPA